MNSTTFLMINSVTHPLEWSAMWSALIGHWHGDAADYNDRYGESWQYMGTELRGDNWEHVFRHRMHPKTNRREYHRILASPDYHRKHPLPEPTLTHNNDRDHYARFDPVHCSGSFDGVSVHSDADPGL
jgi:hypothetical protein